MAEKVDAGWSSPVARQAHNLKVVSSNLAPATKLTRQVNGLSGFFVSDSIVVRTVSTVSQQNRRRRLALGPRRERYRARVSVILGALAAVLPNFMVPHAVHWREAMPINPNGKIDRTALAQELTRQLAA